MPEKEIKCVQIRKEEVNLSLFTDDLVLYIENLKEYIHTEEKLLELINDFAKVTGCEIKVQKVNGFFYISNEQSENKIPLITASKGIKYLGF